MRFHDSGTRLRGVVVAGTQGRPDRIDWNQPASELLIGCQWDPGGSTEDISSEQTVVTSPSAILPPNSDITAVDRWRYEGQVFEIDGDVARHKNRHGRPRYDEIRLKRVTGG